MKGTLRLSSSTLEKGNPLPFLFSLSSLGGRGGWWAVQMWAVIKDKENGQVMVRDEKKGNGSGRSCRDKAQEEAKYKTLFFLFPFVLR